MTAAGERDARLAADRSVLTRVPAYAEQVAKIASTADARIRDRRRELIAGLRADDAERSERARPRIAWWRSAALVVAVLVAAGAFAFYFSRADISPRAGTPWAMSLAAASAVFYAVAALPARRADPPSAQVATVGWILAVLDAAAVAFAAFLAFQFFPDAAGWLAVGAGGVAVVVAIAAAASYARRGVPREPRASGRSDGADWAVELGRTVEEVRADALARLSDAHLALDAGERELLGALADDPPGRSLVDAVIDRAAAAVGAVRPAG